MKLAAMVEMAMQYLNCGWYDRGPEFLVLSNLNTTSGQQLLWTEQAQELKGKKRIEFLFLDYKQAESDSPASTQAVFQHQTLLSLVITTLHIDVPPKYVWKHSEPPVRRPSQEPSPGHL